METRSLSLPALSLLFSLSPPDYSIVAFLTLLLAAIGLIGAGRLWCYLIGLQGDLVDARVCSGCVLVSTHGCFSANEVNSVERK